MSLSDYERWEARYRSREDGTLGLPEPFVANVVARLTPGMAADVAGGTGRHALWLAARAWQTTLIDIAPSALRHAELEGAKSGHTLSVTRADFDEVEDRSRALPNDAYDLVVCTWFLPSMALWQRMVAALRPAGHLVYVQPTRKNQLRHPKPSERFLFADDRLADHLRQLGLTVLVYAEGWDERGHHTARALAKRTLT